MEESTVREVKKKKMSNRNSEIPRRNIFSFPLGHTRHDLCGQGIQHQLLLKVLPAGNLWASVKTPVAMAPWPGSSPSRAGGGTRLEISASGTGASRRKIGGGDGGGEGSSMSNRSQENTRKVRVLGVGGC